MAKIEYDDQDGYTMEMKTRKFKSYKQLMKFKCVKEWTELPNFTQFSLGYDYDDDHGEYYLMAEYSKDRKDAAVVGTVYDAEFLKNHLPLLLHDDDGNPINN